MVNSPKGTPPSSYLKIQLFSSFKIVMLSAVERKYVELDGSE